MGNYATKEEVIIAGNDANVKNSVDTIDILGVVAFVGVIILTSCCCYGVYRHINKKMTKALSAQVQMEFRRSQEKV